jgi:hypothetical protein
VNGEHASKISHRAARAVAALLSEPSIEKAATRAGVADRTLRGWLKNDAFLQLYRDAQRRAVEHALGRLAALTNAAHDALERNLSSGPPGTQVTAALGILDRATKGCELSEIMQRLQRLEEAQRKGATP